MGNPSAFSVVLQDLELPWWWKGLEWIFPAGGSCETLLGCRTAGNSANISNVFFWVGNPSFRIHSKQFLAEPLPEKPFKESENTLTSLTLHGIIKDTRLWMFL